MNIPMRAGLLADIILGESPHLKGLVRFFNLLVLDTNGKITGFNTQFLVNSKREETQLLYQPFVRLFDSDEGKADLQLAIKQGLRGLPSAISFYLFDSKVHFKGVILPVYDRGHQPTSLIIISKEELRVQMRNEELEDFWVVARQLITEAGISVEGSLKPTRTNTLKPKILILEDSKGLISSIFNESSKSDFEFRFAKSTEEVLAIANSYLPNVVITGYSPLGEIDISRFTLELKTNHKISVIFLSAEENQIRIEDGWLDIRVRNQHDSAHKILELISQMYW